MCEDAGVAGGAGELFVLFEGDVGLGLGMAKAFGEAIVDDVDGGGGGSFAYGKVIWLDVPMQVAFIVEGGYAGNLTSETGCPTVCSAMAKVVGNDSLLLHMCRRLSKLGPNSSITIALYSPSVPSQYTLGIPVFPCRSL